MRDAPLWLWMLGFFGQALFFARILLQWVASERAGRSVVPRAFWHLSLGGAACILAYSLLADNLVFALSVVPGAVISARNLFIRRPAARSALLPSATILAALIVWAVLVRPYVGSPLWASIGLTGALIWGSRFLVQWWISERVGRSTLPFAFWMLSLAGSLLLLGYGIDRGDLVMIVAYAVGCIPYVRNMMLFRAALT